SSPFSSPLWRHSSTAWHTSRHPFPPFLLDLKSWHAQGYDDYLVTEKSYFFLGIWPLAVARVYGISAEKSWLGNACLLYGASTLTSMLANCCCDKREGDFYETSTRMNQILRRAFWFSPNMQYIGAAVAPLEAFQRLYL
ncbi:transmembrane protein 97, partial [Striga asiatica]